MAIDGHRSTFVGGGSIDQFTEMVDLSPSEKVAAIRWQTLKLQSSLDSAEQIEFDNLTTQLSNKIFSAEKFNTLADCIVALEIFFRDNVEGYITTKQQEFDATLQKFSDQGIWSNITTYQQWNTISFNNETFLSRKDNNLNHTPVGDVTDIWWHKVAQRGRQGEPGLGLRFTGLFSISKTYSENDAVAYYGDDGYAIYYCLSTCMGIEPTDANHWAIFMSLAQLSSIIGDTNNLLTEDKSSLVNAFNEVFQSVSDGKAQLETAITDMRGAVSKEGEIVSFNELESGVRSIPISKGNALPEHVLEPYTFTNYDGVEYTGAMINNGSASAETINLTTQNQEYTIAKGYHSGLRKIKAVISGLVAGVIKAGTTVGGIIGTFTNDATATASQMLAGATAWVEGIKVTGTIPSKGAATITPSTTDQTIAAEQYLSEAQTIKGDANLVGANIKEGISIFNKVGTLTPLPTPSVGDHIVVISTNETASLRSESEWLKMKEIKVNRAGTYRVSFEIKGYGSQGRVFKNGSAIGIIRNAASTYTKFTEDFTFAANDLVQLYMQTSSEYTSFREFTFAINLGTLYGVQTFTN